MSRYYLEALDGLKRLPANNEGLVSFEYVIVTACVVAAVVAAFNSWC